MKHEKHDLARTLYLETTLTQAQIAEQLKVNPKTFYFWMKDGEWKRMKKIARHAPVVITESFYEQLAELNYAISQREFGERYPTREEAEISRKLMLSIDKAKKRIGPAESLQVVKSFVNLILAADPDLGKQVVTFADKYVQTEVKRGVNPFDVDYMKDDDETAWEREMQKQCLDEIAKEKEEEKKQKEASNTVTLSPAEGPAEPPAEEPAGIPHPPGRSEALRTFFDSLREHELNKKGKEEVITEKLNYLGEDYKRFTYYDGKLDSIILVEDKIPMLKHPLQLPDPSVVMHTEIKTIGGLLMKEIYIPGERYAVLPVVDPATITAEEVAALQPGTPILQSRVLVNTTDEGQVEELITVDDKIYSAFGADGLVHCSFEVYLGPDGTYIIKL